ncbi:MAG: cytochrome P450 [Thermoactinospora sp.]|nr:cytochrome P450 [Thermoactinospora sp.]
MTAADLLGFDPADPEFLRDPYPTYGRLREHAPLVRTPLGMLLATTHERCTAVLRDPRFGHGATGAESFLFMDPPQHTRLRSLVSKAFTPRMVERLRPRIEGIAKQLVDELPAEADLIARFAYPLPVLVITELLGVPANDHERFRGWSEKLARSLDPLLPSDEEAQTLRARAEFREYFRELIVLRRLWPGDDLLSALVENQELTEDEMVATCILLLVAGHETTVNLIANGVLALSRHDMWALASDRPRQVVEEVLRYDPPVQLTGRVSLVDTEISAKGEMVLLLLGAANRDPAIFHSPEVFDPLSSSPRHLAFGLGIHFCLGATLARLEGEIALKELARREPRLLERAPPYKENLVLRGLARLQVRLS